MSDQGRPRLLMSVVVRKTKSGQPLLWCEPLTPKKHMDNITVRHLPPRLAALTTGGIR